MPTVNAHGPRRVLAAVAVAALLVTAGCAGVLGTAPTNANDASGATGPTVAQQGSTVFVTASGQAKTDPDKAVVRVAVETTADTAQAAREQLAENTSRMRQALLEMGLSEDQMSTVHYDLDRDHRRPPPEQRDGEVEIRYRGYHVMEITLTDLDRVGKAVDTAVNNGATRVDGVRFTLTQETRRDLKQQALTDAMGNAKNEATTVADAASLELRKVHTIETGRSGGPHRYLETAVATAAAGGDGGTEFDAGPVTVTATVSVTYNATGA